MTAHSVAASNGAGVWACDSNGDLQLYPPLVGTDALAIFLAALAIAIGAVFIWYGITGDPIVIGLIPVYVIIVVWSVTYYFIKSGN